MIIKSKLIHKERSVMKMEWRCYIKIYLQKSQKRIIDMITEWNLVGNSKLWLTFEMIFILLFKATNREPFQVACLLHVLHVFCSPSIHTMQ